METNQSPNNEGVRITPMREVIARMITQLSPVALRNNNSITNEIPNELQTGINEDMLVDILSQLVGVISNEAQNSSIRISAQQHQDLILFNVKGNQKFNFSLASEALGELQPMIAKVKGYIGVTTYVDNSATIAFSFSNIFRDQAS